MSDENSADDIGVSFESNPSAAFDAGVAAERARCADIAKDAIATGALWVEANKPSHASAGFAHGALLSAAKALHDIEHPEGEA